jgi:acyl-CoA thioesterase-1
MMRLFLLVAFALRVSALEPLTDAERKQLADGEASAKSHPEMRKVVESYRAARTAFREDQKKPAAARDPDALLAYRRATALYEVALENAMRKADPELVPLLAKRAALKKVGLNKVNEGETAVDSASRENAAMQPVKEDPALPRVLLIGDSISIGYTLVVREKLKGKANVIRPLTNCSSTGNGLRYLASWLGDQKWDVIHFNFGLHDAKLPPEGERHAPPAVYEKNLRELVNRMQTTGAKLVFATTTPVPNGGYLSPVRRFGSVDEYNALARKVMVELGVGVNDLNSAAKAIMEKYGRPTDVHFLPEGYEVLGAAVAASVEAVLARP